jgi:hypothetical protein
MANPVQPSSSTKPPTRPIAIPDTSRAALLSVETMAGRKTGEIRESTRSTVVSMIGAVRSATAYQRPPTRNLSNREISSRGPAFPETRTVNRMPATGGPASIAKTAAMNRGSACQLVPARRPEPPTRRNPPQERANVKAKYVSTGCSC